MNQNLVPEQTKANSKTKFLVYTALALFLLGVLAFFALQVLGKIVTPVQTPEVTFTPEEKYVSEGVVYFVATPKDEVIPVLFSLTPKTGAIDRVVGSEYIYDYVQSPSGIKAKSFNKPDGMSYIELSHSANVADTKKIFPKEGTVIGQLALNSKGDSIIYESIPADVYTSKVPLKPEEVSLLLYNMQEDTTTVITNGLNPSLYDDNTLLYTMNDGVYKVSLSEIAAGTSTAFVQKIADYEIGVLSENSEIVFSPQKPSVIVTNTKTGSFDSYRVSKESDFSFEDKVTLPGKTIVSSLYSPDGRYLAFLEPVTYENEIVIGTGIIDTVTGKEHTLSRVAVNFSELVHMSVWE